MYTYETAAKNIRLFDTIRLTGFLGPKPPFMARRIEWLDGYGNHTDNALRVIWVDVYDAFGNMTRWASSELVPIQNGGLFRALAEDPFTPRGFRVHEDGRVTHTDLVDGPWFADMSGAL
ncbi:hypothetical protein SEA_SURVIVORS_31 [Gordonia phage Survivors]|nr:hypothetical protein SEA_SURVIVORS_31 [Gordonia phage Survivors]